MDKNNTGRRAANGPSSEGEQEAKGGMRGTTHPSTHRVASWFVCSGRAVPGGRGSVRAGPLGVRSSNTGPMGRQCRRNAKPAQSPTQEHRLPKRSVSSTNHAQRDCRVWGTADEGLRQ